MNPDASLRTWLRARVGESVDLNAGETDEDTLLTDEELDAEIIRANDDREALINVWEVVVGKLSKLVDITEGQSTRRLSQMHAQALKMLIDARENSTQAGQEQADVTRSHHIRNPRRSYRQQNSCGGPSSSWPWP